jgi:hypothetical protein
MDGVREYGDGLPVELHIDDTSGHLVIVAFNEAGNCATYVDLNDVVKWTKVGVGSSSLAVEDVPQTNC